MHAHCRFAQKVCDTSRGVAATAIDEPFIADRFVALDKPTEEALHLRARIDDWIEVLGLSDHDFGSNDGLNAVVGSPVAGQDAFARKAQCDDLAAPRIVGLEF